MRSSNVSDALFQYFYYSRPSFVDGTTQFHRLVRSRVSPGACILEIGPGATNNTTKYLASLGRVIGIDISSEITSNRDLDEAHVYDGHKLPFGDSSFDVCVSDWVMEHIADPAEHVHEVARVLRPGGSYCFRTPNVWHYVYLVSRFTPHWIHRCLANPLRGLSRNAGEPHPTYYRANHATCLKRLGKFHGMVLNHLVLVEPEPSYGRYCLAFFPMMCYERFVNSSSWFETLRATILACYVRS